MRRTVLLVLLLPALAMSQEVITRIIDVGAGHASITKMPGPHYMMFDAGLVGRSEHIIAQMKEIMGADRVIDLMILSHTDADHLGAVPKILEVFDARIVLRAGLFRCGTTDDCPWRLSQNKIREEVGKGGIVREDGLREKAAERVRKFVVDDLHKNWNGLIESPISGSDGNREFLAWLKHE